MSQTPEIQAAVMDAASSMTKTLATYISAAAATAIPGDVAEKAKHHLLDTLAAMVSGSTLKPGRFAILYAESQGGIAEASVAGTRLKTSAVNAALANGMLAHADETDDSHPASITHPGCAVVPAALAMAERNGHDGAAVLRAIVLGYDIASRTTMALGVDEIRSAHRSTHAIGGIFGAGVAAGSLAGLTPSQCCYLLSYLVQQASGVHCWTRDKDHIEKAFDFGGMPARNGVGAATMVAIGMTGVADSLSGDRNFFSAFSRAAQPESLVAELGSRFEIMRTNIKKYSVGSPIQSVLDALDALIVAHGLTADDVAQMDITIPVEHVRVIDNRDMPDVCVQHLAATMVIDGCMTFAASHDVSRMADPAVRALRQRISLVGSAELGQARPRRQAVVAISTRDGRELRHHTRVVRGSADQPMTRNEVADKAQDLMTPVLGLAQSRALIDAVWSIDAQADIRHVCTLFQLPAR